MRIQNLKKNVTLFGLTTVFIPILVTCILLLLVLPAYKNSLIATQVNAAEHSKCISEEQINQLIEAYLCSTNVIECIDEAEVEKLTVILLEEMKASGMEPASVIKEEVVQKLKETVGQQDSALVSKLETIRKELLEKIVQESATNQEKMKVYVDSQKQPDVQGQISDTKQELSGLSNTINTTRTELQTLQAQLDSLQNGMSNCVVRYNPEDGHFYSVYNEGTEQEVSKKLDFAQ